MSCVKTVVIAGPTASGKSQLSLRLAASLGGVVINADSLQVYKEFRVLTARPSASDEALVPHRLYGLISGATSFSVGKWLVAARQEIQRAHDKAQVPIFVGGSGLYLRALIDGLAVIPEVAEKTRSQATELYNRLGGEQFWVKLAKRDPESARQINAADRQRLIRAWEVVEDTGVPISKWRGRMNVGGLEGPVFVIKIMPERSSLYSTCERRFDKMLDSGVLDEVAAVQSLGLPQSLPAMKALGFQAVCRYLSGDLTLDECKASVRQATRNYAKRQLTWFSNQLPAQREYSDGVAAETAAKAAIQEFLLTGDG